MNLLITGATGLVGLRLCEKLADYPHQIFILSRGPQKAASKLGENFHYLPWNSEKPHIPTEVLDQLDAVIHLAGESIANGRWNQEKKRKIYNSRVIGTRQLVQVLSQRSSNHTLTFVSASAIGYYGDAGDKELTENSESSNDFLARVCRDWEKEALKLQNAKSKDRIVLMRTGMVLSSKGGALKKMLLPFKLGMGGVLGSGKQWMSWIHIEDLVSLIIYILENPQISGPVNMTSPQPVTNKAFTQALAQSLLRPAVLPVPAVTLKILFGEMSTLFLSSARVLPVQALKNGFKFQFEDISVALKDLLHRK